MSVGIRVVAWNCRGAKNQQFMCNARNLIATFRPSIFIILEPRIGGVVADAICNRLGLRDWVHSDAEGFSGSLWVLYNIEEISLKAVHIEKFFIHKLIDDGRRSAWVLTAVYASPKHHLRPAIWDRIALIRRTSPLALIGDFNVHLMKEKETLLGDFSFFCSLDAVVGSY